MSIDAIRKSLEGVEKTEWERSENKFNGDWGVYPTYDGPPNFGSWSEICICGSHYDEAEQFSTFIAACNPAAITELLAAHDALKDQNVELKAALTLTQKAEPVAPAVTVKTLADACREMADDYQTSDNHHPNHVLVPLLAFEVMCAALDNKTPSEVKP